MAPKIPACSLSSDLEAELRAQIGKFGASGVNNDPSRFRVCEALVKKQHQVPLQWVKLQGHNHAIYIDIIISA